MVNRGPCKPVVCSLCLRKSPLLDPWQSCLSVAALLRFHRQLLLCLIAVPLLEEARTSGMEPTLSMKDHGKPKIPRAACSVYLVWCTPDNVSRSQRFATGTSIRRIKTPPSSPRGSKYPRISYIYAPQASRRLSCKIIPYQIISYGIISFMHGMIGMMCTYMCVICMCLYRYAYACIYINTYICRARGAHGPSWNQKRP